MKRRILSMVMAVIIMVSLVPIMEVDVSAAPSASEMSAKLNELKSRWHEGFVRYDLKIEAGGFDGGWQCFGFADNVYHELFGGACMRHGEIRTNVNDLCIGDHVRYNSGPSDHSIIITNIKDDTIYYSDCNNDASDWYNSCIVHWDRTVSRATLASWVSRSTHGTPGTVSGYGYIQHFPGNEVRSFAPTRPPIRYENFIQQTIGAVCKGDTLTLGGELRRGEYLMSQNRQYIAILQNDGNFVIYRTDAALWYTSFFIGDDYGAYNLELQSSDGNLVLYKGSNRQNALWNSGTMNKGVAYLKMQDDGNLVVNTADNRTIWHSETFGGGGVDKFFVTEKHNIGEDFYALLIRHDGTVLTNEKTTATKWRTESLDRSQIMRFQRHSDGSYRISALSDNRVLDVRFGIEYHSEIYFQDRHDKSNQRFWIEQKNDESGKIMLSPQSGSYYVVDGAGAQANFPTGSQLFIHPRNDTAEQWFTLKKINNIDEYLNPPPDNLYISAVDPDNTYIELHNPTETPISAKGLYLSNDNGDYFMWQMPLVIVRPNQRVLIKVCDEINGGDMVLARMQIDFDLADGDTLRLSDAGGNVLSVYEVG